MNSGGGGSNFSSDLNPSRLVTNDADGLLDLRDLQSSLPTFSPTVTSSSPALSLDALDVKNCDSGAVSPEVGSKRNLDFGRAGSSMSNPDAGVIGRPRPPPNHQSPAFNSAFTSTGRSLIQNPPLVSTSPLLSCHIPQQPTTNGGCSGDVNSVVTEITSNLRRLADMIERNGGVAGLPLPHSPAATPSPSGPRPNFPISTGLDQLAPLINLDPIAIRNLEMLARVADQSSASSSILSTPCPRGGSLSHGNSPLPPPSMTMDSRSSLLSQPPVMVSPTPPNSSNHTPTPPVPLTRTSKNNPMQIRCKFGQLGTGKGQFSSPHGFCLGMDEEIVIADTNNHRICVYDKSGEFKSSFGIAGKDEGQLWYPRKVAFIRTSSTLNAPRYVICDRGSERSRMQIFTRTGHFVRKIAIRYIDIVAGLAITPAGHIVAVDSVSPTVFVIAETGDLLRWFDCSEHMREPSDVAVNNNEFYICDFKGHCVVVFSEEGQFIRRIGHESLTNFPNGIDVSDAGDVLVGDSHGNRFHVVVFDRRGELLAEFECPYVKVSRCCGLKITSEGYVVTLAKNNHHVLVLNTLYIV